MQIDQDLKDAVISNEDMERAGLTPEERERALEMRDVQVTYLRLLETMSYPVDQNGTTHDVNHMPGTLMALAWTLALSGVRFSGPVYIKKRYPEVPSPGMYEDVHTWVDIRQPDKASDGLRPTDRSTDTSLPPDTRRLAALRDGDEQPQPPPQWKTKPKLRYIEEPRPKDDE